jgi:hypothetical protein
VESLKRVLPRPPAGWRTSTEVADAPNVSAHQVDYLGRRPPWATTVSQSLDVSRHVCTRRRVRRRRRRAECGGSGRCQHASASVSRHEAEMQRGAALAEQTSANRLSHTLRASAIGSSAGLTRPRPDAPSR